MIRKEDLIVMKRYVQEESKEEKEDSRYYTYLHPAYLPPTMINMTNAPTNTSVK
jgi:hypothetical protein